MSALSRRLAVPTLVALAVLAMGLPATAAHAKTSAIDPPFWTGTPDAGQFRKTSEQRLARARAAIDKMVAVKGARTIDNTLRPYDEASFELDQAVSQSSLIENVHPDSNLRTTAEEMTQEGQKLGTEISLDRRVYEALAALDLSKADAETRFYVERELRDFKLAGVDRDEPTREKIKALRDEIVKIGQEFDRNIRSDVRTIQATPAELQGLPEDFTASRKPGADGTITLTINYPDYIPVMTYAKDDGVRKRFYMEFQNRGYPKNVEVLNRMFARRHELATLLGFSSWADYITANKMVGSAKNVRDFIDKIVAASGPVAEREYRQLLQRKQKDVPGAQVVNFWETGYWQENVRKSDYQFDSQSVRPYFPYARVQQGILDITGKMFGVTYRKVKDAPVWHPSVECFEMIENGQVVGRFYLDMHPRENKYNHAAQFDIRTGISGKHIPEAALVCNLPGGEAGDPGLCEIDDVETALHEFGHLLHTLFAGRRQWTGVSGIRTEHDFVEAPSQMLEEWMKDPATLATFAKHHETNQPIPADLVRQMVRAKEYGKGLAVRRQMVYADLSLSVYNQDPAKVDASALTKSLVARYQPFPFVDGTHFECAFGHLDGYSAVYYTYMWSEVIARDMFSKFDKTNLLDPGVAGQYRQKVLAAGGSAPAAKLVESFLGRPYGFNAYESWLNQESEITAR